MADYDLIVVGAGHNALVAAAYAAQAGYRVGVFERRPIVGGAVSTVEITPGYQFDLGGSAHILIRLTPIVEELGLEQFGLDYIELDPLFYAPFEDGEQVYIYRDSDRTCHALEESFPGEGEAYARFIDEWQPFARTVRDAFLSTPSPFELAKAMILGESAQLDWQRALRRILQPYGEVVDEYFSEEKVKAPLVWMAAQSGPPPSEPLTAPFLLWHPLYHESGVARPRGGSGGLTQALKRHIGAHGGDVLTSMPATRFLIERNRIAGIEAGGERITAKAVLAGTHVFESLGRLLPEAHRSAALGSMRVGNGFGAILRLALDRPIQYLGDEEGQARTALQLLCRDRQQIQAAYGEYLQGRPASDPPIVAMSFSAVDDSLAPPGGEVLWLWAQYFPYEMSNDRSWDAQSEQVANTILNAFEAYAPGIRDHMTGCLFQHPEWLERELGLFRGNVMHLEMSIDQMFGLRPNADFSGYEGPLEGLFLTGASMHPGGGIMGAAGRNAARVVLRYLNF